MIAWLRGNPVQRDGHRIVLDVQGVGYEVFAPTRTVEHWSQSGDTVEAHISTQVREDAITLYGFQSALERSTFQTLLSVSGIGPKLALACLDALPVSSLVRAVESGDHGTLGRIPGVGKKTAQRLALELKGKLDIAFDPNAAPLTAPPKDDDALGQALTRLGYTRQEISTVRQGLLAEGVAQDAPIADRLRMALRLLYRSDT